MEAFLVVLNKLAIMTIMIFVGWIISKKGKLSEKTATELTWVLLNIVTPMLIIDSFSNLESGSVKTENLLLGVVLSALSISIGVFLSRFFFKKEEINKQKVLRFAMTYSNASFMGMPLVQSIVGQEGVVYASIFISVFNFMIWTFGYRLMSTDKKLSITKILFNPGTIGFVIGLIIYLFNINLPEILSSPLSDIASLNTPLAMFIFGFYIASVNLKELVTDKKIYYLSFLRLLAMPAIMLIFLVLVKPVAPMFLSIAIQSCAPVATTTVLFSALMKTDTELASKVVAATNILCLITIPFFVSLVQIIVDTIL